MERREFLKVAAVAAVATQFGTEFWRTSFAGASPLPGPGPYGDLLAADANGVQLPPGFTARVIGRSNQVVGTTSQPWHLAPDGGGCFPSAGGGWTYVSNSEVASGQGGVTAIRFDSAANITDAYRILNGTSKNCAGGVTPWGTWLSCEENNSQGKVYECDPQTADSGVQRAALGSFNHEAAVVDPSTGWVYLTEDDPAGRLYRFVPLNAGDLSAGALFAANVQNGFITWTPTSNTQPDRQAGTTGFNGGEGMWMGSGVFYFTTKGDKKVWEVEPATGRITVLYDCLAVVSGALNAVDNITVHANSGDLYVAEDGGNMELCILGYVGADRQVAPFARLIGQNASEITGPAFSPDGSRLYFSSQRGTDGVNGITYEVSGPFRTATAPPPIETLVSAGSAWKYLDNGTSPAGWETRQFTDGGWVSGFAPLGYGDPVVTTVGYGPDAQNKYITTYFRRTFTATHGFTSMVIRLRRDDGAVIYINGSEVARSNMPAGTINPDTRAPAAINLNDEVWYFDLPVTPTLYAGDNVIAVELHQNSGNSSDLNFDLALIGTGNTGPLGPPPNNAVPVTLPIGVDSYVRGGTFGDQNFGADQLLHVCANGSPTYTRVGYLSVDTAAFAGSVGNALLRVNARMASGTSTMAVYPVADTTWTEGAITWNNSPAPGPVALGSFPVTSTTGTWFEVDVTAYVAAERAAGRTKVAFAIKQPTVSPLGYINSSENPTNRPEIKLTAGDPPPPPVVPMTLPVGVDSYVRGGTFGDQNFGADQLLHVCANGSPTYTRVGYLSVDTAAFAGSVGNALLRVNARMASGTSTMAVHPVADTTWTEGAITWNNSPAPGPVALGSFPVTSTTGTWFEVDVTAYVAAERAAGRTKVAFAVKQPTVSPLGYINSSENPTSPPEIKLTPGDPPPPPPAEPATVPITIDSYVRGGTFADQNFGADGLIHVCASSLPSYTRVGYLLVDTSAFAGAVGTARLRVNAHMSSGTSTLAVYPVADTSWIEGAITWNNMPAAGASALGSFALPTTSPTWFEIDVTAYVASERAAGRTKVAFAIKQPSNAPLAYVNSSENAASRPEIYLAPPA